MDGSLNPIDRTLQTVTPTVMVPRHEEFSSLATPGHRFLVAEDGLWIEIWRPWLYVRVPLATQDRVAMPYGKLGHHVELGCGKIKWQPLVDFMRDAAATPHTEIGRHHLECGHECLAVRALRRDQRLRQPYQLRAPASGRTGASGGGHAFAWAARGGLLQHG